MKHKVKHNLNYPWTKSNFTRVLDMFSDVKLQLKQLL